MQRGDTVKAVLYKGRFNNATGFIYRDGYYDDGHWTSISFFILRERQLKHSPALLTEKAFDRKRQENGI